jgi:hypothetical protein
MPIRRRVSCNPLRTPPRHDLSSQAAQSGTCGLDCDGHACPGGARDGHRMITSGRRSRGCCRPVPLTLPRRMCPVSHCSTVLARDSPARRARYSPGPHPPRWTTHGARPGGNKDRSGEDSIERGRQESAGLVFTRLSAAVSRCWAPWPGMSAPTATRSSQHQDARRASFTVPAIAPAARRRVRRALCNSASDLLFTSVGILGSVDPPDAGEARGRRSRVHAEALASPMRDRPAFPIA